MRSRRPTLRIRLALVGLLALAPGARAATGWQVEKVALQGEAAPGTSETFEAFDVSRESGTAVLFVAMLSGSPPSWGLYRHDAGAVTPLALPGTPAPGAGNALFQVPLSFPSGSAGDFSFATLLTGGTASRGLFADTGAGLAPVFLEGDAAPDGGTFVPDTGQLTIHDRNASGEIVFRSTLAGTTASSGVFLGGGGSLARLAAHGEAAPGGGTWAAFEMPTLDDAGTVFFPATLTGGVAPGGVFRHADGTTTALVLAGDGAPGTGGSVFDSFHYPKAGPGDSVVFLAGTSGGAATGGVFRATSGGVEALLVENDPIPATGGLLTSFTSLPTQGSDGALAFSGGFTGGAAASGVLVRAPDGEIRPVALAGEPAPDAGGASFATFGFVGLDANGSVAFQADLSDGRSGLFSAQPLAAVPTLPGPAATALVALLLATALVASRQPVAAARRHTGRTPV